MTANRQSYNVIKQGLEQLYPDKISPRMAQHLHTLALIVHGIIGSAHSQLPKLAGETPELTKTESQIAKLKRWLTNEQVTEQLYWLPFAKALLGALSRHKNELRLVMDGSVVGRGCMALMVSVVYAGRSLPVGWLVVKGKKGHLAQQNHLELLAKIAPLVPEGVPVVFLGDGEFDGCLLLSELEALGWHYVCRTAKTSQLRQGSGWSSFQDLAVKTGEIMSLAGVGFTSEGYGTLLAVGWWDKRYQEPIYLISNLNCPYQVCDYYRSRFRIETFFSDSKSRGFRIEQSHLSEPSRLSKLLIGCALAYWWLIYLGTVAFEEGYDQIIHRTTRSDLSMFQIGWRYFKQAFKRDWPLPFKLLELPASAHF